MEKVKLEAIKSRARKVAKDLCISEKLATQELIHAHGYRLVNFNGHAHQDNRPRLFKI